MEDFHGHGLDNLQEEEIREASISNMQPVITLTMISSLLNTTSEFNFTLNSQMYGGLEGQNITTFEKT